MATNDAVVRSVTFPNFDDTSTALKMPHTFYLAGILKKADLEGSLLTFEVSMDGETYFPLYDRAGDKITFNITNNTQEAIVFPPEEFYPWEYVKLVTVFSQQGIAVVQLVVKQY